MKATPSFNASSRRIWCIWKDISLSFDVGSFLLINKISRDWIPWTIKVCPGLLGQAVFAFIGPINFFLIRHHTVSVAWIELAALNPVLYGIPLFLSAYFEPVI